MGWKNKLNRNKRKGGALLENAISISANCLINTTASQAKETQSRTTKFSTFWNRTQRPRVIPAKNKIWHTLIQASVSAQMTAPKSVSWSAPWPQPNDTWRSSQVARHTGLQLWGKGNLLEHNVRYIPSVVPVAATGLQSITRKQAVLY